MKQTWISGDELGWRMNRCSTDLTDWLLNADADADADADAQVWIMVLMQREINSIQDQYSLWRIHKDEINNHNRTTTDIYTQTNNSINSIIFILQVTLSSHYHLPSHLNEFSL